MTRLAYEKCVWDILSKERFERCSSTSLFVIVCKALLEMPLELRISQTLLCVSALRDISVFRDSLQQGWPVGDALELEDAMSKERNLMPDG